MTTATAPDPALVLRDFLTSRDPFAIIAARHGLTLAGLRTLLESPESRTEIEAFHALTRLRRAPAARTGGPPANPRVPRVCSETRAPAPPLHSSTTPTPTPRTQPSPHPDQAARIAAATALRTRILQNATAAGLTPAALQELAGITPPSTPLHTHPRPP